MIRSYSSVLSAGATVFGLDGWGLGLDYRRKDEKGTFVVETHNLYERELLVGERVRIATQILGSDDKRLYVGHEMFRVRDRERSATQELMFLHIDLKARRVTPFPPERRERGAARAAAHAGFPRPGRGRRRGRFSGDSYGGAGAGPHSGGERRRPPRG